MVPPLFGDRWPGLNPDGSGFTEECTLNVSGAYTIWMYAWQGNESGSFDIYLARISAPTTQAATPISYKCPRLRHDPGDEVVPVHVYGRHRGDCIGDSV